MRVNISTTVPTNTTVHEVERKKTFCQKKKFRRRESGMASTAACLRLDKQDGKLIP